MKSTSHLKSTITPSARGAMRCSPLGRIFLFVAHLLACIALAPVSQACVQRPDAWATYVASHSFIANWSGVTGATSYRLDVSTTSSFSTYVPGYQNLNVGNVTRRIVTGLNPSTAYYFRVRAYKGTKPCPYSSTVQVPTLSPTGRPVVITNPATFIASYSARLKGTVDPHGLTTTVYFQYGTTTSYGLTTAIQSKTGNTYQIVAATIGGLTASTTYHFRIVATNSAGTRYGADQTFTTLRPTGPTPTPNPFDFNGDGKTDYVLQNVSTHQTALWYLNNNTFLRGAYGPTLPAGWSLVDVADFNGGGKPDYALFNPTTRQTAIWYMNNNALIGGAYGPALPSGWSLVATGDFNNDSKPDYALFNPTTRQTAIWFMNNNVFVSGASVRLFRLAGA